MTASGSASILLVDEGLIYHHSQRRRLSFIKRISSDKGYNSWSAHETTQTVQNTAIPKDWNHSNQPYYNVKGWNDDCFDIHKERPFVAFHVAVPSLYYVGFEGGLKNVEHTDIMTTWRTVYRRQVGSHVFINRYGHLVQLYSFMDGGLYLIHNKIHSIDSIYPIIRYEINAKPPEVPKNSTVLGRQYIGFKDYDEGDRYYHRYSSNQVKRGGVYELTPDKMNNLDNEIMAKKLQNKLLFGFFVCAGARLVVFDDCQDETNRLHNEKHNLALIQQGGVVFVKVAEGSDLNFTEGFGKTKVCFNWKKFTQRLRVAYDKSDPLSGLSDFKNPIIFIGANDSNHNSIAWSLSLELKRGARDKIIPGSILTAYLTIPEGGRIEAIADAGADGMKEIIERIHYEYLHDSVLTNHGIVFTACAPDRIERILNVNEVRSYYYEHNDFKTPVEKFCAIKMTTQGYRPKIPLFRQFNVRKVTKVYEDYFKTPTQPPLPPMYPLLYTSTGVNSRDICIPNQTNSASVEKCYPGELEIDNSLDPYKQKYKFKDMSGVIHECKLYYALNVPEYNWIKLPQPMMDITHKDIDGVDKRIGVDGWVWERQSTKAIFECLSVFYCSDQDISKATNYTETLDTYKPEPIVAAHPPQAIRRGKGQAKKRGAKR